MQFGEGGAGLFSDGKLYSQIKDPKFYGRKVMHEFVRAGAPEEILFVSKPHIGTFRLTGIVEKMRAEIIALGGEVRFESKVTDLLIDDGQVEGAMLENGETLQSRHVVLALGHSSRDTLRMLERRGVFLEAKPFAIGFRIEHPQSLIDRARFGRFAGHPELGAADYKLVHHASNGRSVYSFCMCPGGTVVAATSEPGRVVTNGMSQYSRNERNANAGIVVGIEPGTDFPGGPLAGVALQEALESTAFELGGGDYCAPGQLVGDFLRGKPSHAAGRGRAVIQAGRQTRRPGAVAARLCDRCDPRSAADVRPADPWLRSRRRDADGRRDAHVVAGAHHARRGFTAEPERARPVPLRRRRGLRGRDPLRRCRWHQGGRSGRAGDGMKFEDLKKLHQKKFREELGHFVVEGEHLVQELEKAAKRDARLRASEIYLTRDYAHWSSPLPMHVIQSMQMAQISETRSPQGIAAVVPLLATAAPRAGERAIYLHEIQDPGISARSCARWRGSAISAASRARTAWTCTTARWCARAWARSSTCQSSSTCRSPR